MAKKKFYKPEYDEYYSSLVEQSDLESNVTKLESDMDGIKTELSGVQSLFVELQGDYSKELNGTLSAIDTMITSVNQTVSTELPKATGAMKQLGSDLKEMKPKDETYQSKEDTLEGYGGKPTQYKKTSDGEYEKDENGNMVTNPAYTAYQQLQKEIDELVEVLEKLVESSDNQIEIIKKFNDAIVEARIKIASFQYATEGADFENFDSLSLLEKENFIKTLIDKMTKKYEDYKAKYEEFTKIYEHMDDEQYQAFQNILFGLGIISTKDLSASFMSDPSAYSPIDYGLMMLDVFDSLEKNNVLPVVKKYLFDGEGWVESGMADLYLKTHYEFRFEEEGTYDYDFNKDAVYEMGEEWFWSQIEGYSDIMGMYDQSDESKKKMYTKFNEAFNIFKVDCEGFKENFQKAGNASIAVQGLRELKSHMQFDSVFTSEGFQNFESSWTNDEAFANSDTFKRLVELAPDDHKNFYQWMSADERKMLEYLYTTDESGNLAKDYIDSMKLSFNRREGYVLAKEFYKELHEGSNEGWEAVGDHVESFMAGNGYGLYKFGGDIVNVISPNKEYSKFDYFNMSTVSILSKSDDPYDNGILIAYNLGETTGELVVPLVVGCFNPIAGAALSTAASIGGKMKEQSVANYALASDDTSGVERMSQWELFRNAASATGAEKGTDFVMDLDPKLKLFKPLVKALTSDTFTSDGIGLLFSKDDEAAIARNMAKEEDLTGYGLGWKTAPGTWETKDIDLSGGIDKAVDKYASGKVGDGLNSLIQLGARGLGASKEQAEAIGKFAKPVTDVAGKATYGTLQDIAVEKFDDSHGNDAPSDNGSELFTGNKTYRTIAGAAELATELIPAASAEERENTSETDKPSFGERFVSKLKKETIGTGEEAGTKLWDTGKSVYDSGKSGASEFKDAETKKQEKARKGK